MMDFYINMIREIADYQEVRSGDAVQGVRAESHFNALVAQNDLKLVQNLNSMAWGLEKLGHMILAEMKEHYDDTRMLSLAGPQGEPEVFAFKKAAMSSSTTVKFHLSTFAASNRISQIATARDLWEAGVLQSLNGNPQDPESIKKGAQQFMRLINLEGDIEQTPGNEHLNRTLAQWENKRFEELSRQLNGLAEPMIMENDFLMKLPVVFPHHDHAAHIEEHERYMLSLEFAKLLNEKTDFSNRLYMAFDEHLKSHKKEHQDDSLETAQDTAEVQATASGMFLMPPGGEGAQANG